MKRGRMVGLGSVNNVPRATAAYGAARHEDSQLWADLTAANTVISELRGKNVDNRTQIRGMTWMYDLIAETNLALAQMWQDVRQNMNLHPTPKEQEELERQAEHRSSQLRDDLNLS